MQETGFWQIKEIIAQGSFSKMNHDGFSPELRTFLIIFVIIAIGMRNIWSQESQVARAKIGNMITDESLARTFCNHYNLVFGMIMPGRGIVVIIKVFHYEGIVLFLGQVFQRRLHSID